MPGTHAADGRTMEPTLNLQKTDLYAAAGKFLGYGTNSANWTSDQLENIQFCSNSGYRQFLYPAMGDAKTSYDWSFLKPTASLVLPAGDSVINLPDDFGGF